MQPFTVITPTGDRQETFKLCVEYVRRQTVQPAEWIVVDDGKTPTPAPNLPYTKYLRRPRTSFDGSHTLAAQMQCALLRVTTNAVVVVEDDDWYHPAHCEKLLALFDDASRPVLVGQGHMIYYHVPKQRVYCMRNEDRASWCQTAFTSALFDVVINACKHSTDPFVDLRTWRLSTSKLVHVETPPTCVGIKGLPGRQSTMTMGHKCQHPLFKYDAGSAVFQELLGDDAKNYHNYLGIDA